jgi:hypothetical protein
LPSIEDGSFYAGYIAIYDNGHHTYYHEKIIEGIATGRIPPYLLGKYMCNGSFSAYERLIESIRGYNYAAFDVTSMLKGIMPNYLQEIRTAISTHCPVMRIFTIYRTFRINDNNINEPYRNLDFGNDDRPQFKKEYFLHVNSMDQICPVGEDKLFHTWEVADTQKERLILYVVF